MSLLRRIATAPLRLYRRFVSPIKPPMCRFAPTCSQYAIEAVEVHGLARGGLLATWRILRCHPLCKGGYDPVPPPRARRRVAHREHDVTDGRKERR